jgi:hypothetical protein
VCASKALRNGTVLSGAELINSNCQKALKERGIDKLLEEAREDNKENDATLMGRKKCKFENPNPNFLVVSNMPVLWRTVEERLPYNSTV